MPIRVIRNEAFDLEYGLDSRDFECLLADRINSIVTNGD